LKGTGVSSLSLTARVLSPTTAKELPPKELKPWAEMGKPQFNQQHKSEGCQKINKLTL
jgi:hypothetical protein